MALFEFNDSRVMAQLEDRVNALVALVLKFLKAVKVPRIEDERFLADSVCIRPQCKPNVSVVQIIW